MRKFMLPVLCAAFATAVFAASWAQLAKYRQIDARGTAAVERRSGADMRRTAIVRGVSERNVVEAATERSGSPPKVPPVSVRIAGDIEMAGSEAPTVIVRFGSRQIPAVVNGNTFTADLIYVNAASIVSIEMSKSNLQYRALLGSAALLKRQAGADGRLEIAENPSLRVSPLSTAIHFFIHRELGGRLPVSDAEMDKALRALTVADLAPATNLQRVILQGERQLPTGFASATELLQDRNAYRQFLDAYPEIRNGADAIVRSLPAGAFAAGDLDRNWLLTTWIGRNGVSFFQPIVQLMKRRSGGFSVSAPQSRRSPDFAAEILIDGDLRTTPEGPAYFDTPVVNTQVEPNTALQPIVSRVTVVRETYRRMFVGKQQQLWLQVREESRHFPQYPSQPAVTATIATLLNASVLEEAVVPFTAADVLGRRAMPYFCLQPSRINSEPSVLQNCEFALHTMGSNGFGQVEGLGPKVDANLAPIAAGDSDGVLWRIDDDGSLRIDSRDASARFWRLGISDGVGDAMVFEVTAQGAGGTQIMAGHTIVLNGNLPVFFGTGEPAGTWSYGSFDLPAEYAYLPQSSPDGSRFIRSADGTQIQTTFITEGFGEPAFLLTQRSGWRLVGLNLYDTRYRANIPAGDFTFQFFHSCESAFLLGATQCAPTRVRYFRPIARVGNRWYGIEDLYTRLVTNTYNPPFKFERASRANYYDRL